MLSHKIANTFVGRYIHFKSSCELFKKFDVIVYVRKVYMLNNEIIIEGNRSNGKKISIGSNMQGLEFTFMKSFLK